MYHISKGNGVMFNKRKNQNPDQEIVYDETTTQQRKFQKPMAFSGKVW